MQAAIIFVEYLISGAMAMLWLYLLPLPTELQKLSTDRGAVVAIAFLYVLGMMVDFISARVVGPLKRIIKRRLSKQPAWLFIENLNPPVYSNAAALMYLSKELGAEHQALSSRDRMARGAFLNFLIVTAMLAFSKAEFGVGSKPVEVSVALTCTVLMLAVWWQYENHSQRHRKDALATVLQMKDRMPFAKEVAVTDHRQSLRTEEKPNEPNGKN
jgi:hypothetical protein